MQVLASTRGSPSARQRANSRQGANHTLRWLGGSTGSHWFGCITRDRSRTGILLNDLSADHHSVTSPSSQQFLFSSPTIFSQIFIKTLTGRKQAFNFEPENQVLAVKKALQEKEGIQVDQIRLIFSGKQL